MRIVLLNQYYAPSDAPTAVLAADLGRSLVENGHEVHVVASSRAYNDPRRTYPRREALDGVQVRRTWCSGFGRGGKLGRVVDYATYLLGAAWALLRVPRPDVVVALTTPPMLARIALPLARRRGAKLVYWVMDVYPDLAFELGVIRPDGWIGRLLKRAADSTLRGADLVVALGWAMAQRLRDQGAPNVEAVDNWCDGEVIRPQDRAGHPLRQAQGWDDRFVVLYSGNMGLAHEFTTVLDAADRLSARERILFAFVGGGARLAEIREGAAARSLNNVEFHPYVSAEELAASLTSADVHLVTLRAGLEGLLVPSKIYGVMAAGLPTVYVGPAASEIATLLEEGPCGIRVEGGDTAGLVDALGRYADDEGLRLAHGRAARERFETAYDRPHALAKLNGLIDSLVRDA